MASQLRELGASSDNAIATIMEKGWEQVVAVQGMTFTPGGKFCFNQSCTFTCVCSSTRSHLAKTDIHPTP
ncbi:hypothetical protein, partial [Fischerella thermalis]|uniref:hypothetical protein n=1 Tax=Fischerella thermalis TaxID=372787 RepID=UPI001CA4DD17